MTRAATRGERVAAAEDEAALLHLADDAPDPGGCLTEAAIDLDPGGGGPKGDDAPSSSLTGCSSDDVQH